MLLLGQLKARITPHQTANEQQENVKLTDYSVRIIKQGDVEDPAKSNVEFILSLFGPASHQIRLSYIFDKESAVAQLVANRLKMELADIFISPTTLLLLCHFTNSITSTEVQIAKTLINIYERMHVNAQTLTTSMLL